MKQDLTQYSDNELSLVVMNEEYFYRMRRQILRSPNILEDFFIFDADQLEVLLQDLREDLEET